MDIRNVLNWDTDRYCAIVIILFEVYYFLFYIYDSSLSLQTILHQDCDPLTLVVFERLKIDLSRASIT